MIDFQPIVPVMALIAVGVIVALLIIAFLFSRANKLSKIRRIVILLIAILILLRPVIDNGSDVTENNNLNIFFAVDSTSSMSAKDVGNLQRLEQAKTDIASIADALPGSQYSIVLLEGAAHAVMPLSSNRDLLDASIKSIEQRRSENRNGTDLNDLVDTANKHIESYSKSNLDRINVLFIFSDGEETANTAINVKSLLKNYLVGGGVFGYGSEKGTIMESYDPYENNYSDCITYSGNNSNVRTEKINNMDCVVTSINETSLKGIAASLGLKYYHRDNGEIPREIINDIKSKIVYRSDSTMDGYIETYWIFAMIALALLLWEFADSFYMILLERSRNG